MKPDMLFTLGVIIIMTMIMSVMIYYQRASTRPGTIVLPAGGTYLGPNAPK